MPEEPVEKPEVIEEISEIVEEVPTEVLEKESFEASEEVIEETASLNTPDPVTTDEKVIPKQSVERPAVKQSLPEEKKKSNRGFIIGLIAFLLLAILGLLYLLFFKAVYAFCNGFVYGACSQ